MYTVCTKEKQRRYYRTTCAAINASIINVLESKQTSTLAKLREKGTLAAKRTLDSHGHCSLLIFSLVPSSDVVVNTTVIVGALQVLSINQTFNALLDERRSGGESNRKLFGHLRNQIVVT